jgi:hypothetical protein
MLEDDVWIVGVINWPVGFALLDLMSDHDSEL